MQGLGLQVMFSGAKCGDGGGPKCRSAGPSSMMFKVEEIRCKLGSIPASPISARLQCMQDVVCTLKKMRQYCKQMTSLICRGVEKGKGGKGSGQGRGNGKARIISRIRCQLGEAGGDCSSSRHSGRPQPPLTNGKRTGDRPLCPACLRLFLSKVAHQQETLPLAAATLRLDRLGGLVLWCNSF